jgi:hypothetical protein
LEQSCCDSQQRRLSCAVRAEEGDPTPDRHVQADPEKNVEVAVGELDVTDLEERLGRHSRLGVVRRRLGRGT